MDRDTVFMVWLMMVWLRAVRPLHHGGGARASPVPTALGDDMYRTYVELRTKALRVDSLGTVLDSPKNSKIQV